MVSYLEALVELGQTPRADAANLGVDGVEGEFLNWSVSLQVETEKITRDDLPNLTWSLPFPVCKVLAKPKEEDWVFAYAAVRHELASLCSVHRQSVLTSLKRRSNTSGGGLHHATGNHRSSQARSYRRY